MDKPIAETLFDEIIQAKAADGDIVITSCDPHGNPIHFMETEQGVIKTQKSLAANLQAGIVKYLASDNLD